MINMDAGKPLILLRSNIGHSVDQNLPDLT